MHVQILDLHKSDERHGRTQYFNQTFKYEKRDLALVRSEVDEEEYPINTQEYERSH